jgi:DNA-binding MarR family transcriptional regulator
VKEPAAAGAVVVAAERNDAVEAVRALARVSRVLERASGELNLAHYRVLAAISSGDQRASRVAIRLALGKPAVSSAVDTLVQRGLVMRTGVTTDQRAAALSLTAAGEATLAAAETHMVERITALCARSPDAARVLESLAWLGAALDEAGQDRLTRDRTPPG